ncbi:MAG: type II CAAX endopeptidase family protein [Solirubrobacterales bacterium]
MGVPPGERRGRGRRRRGAAAPRRRGESAGRRERAGPGSAARAPGASRPQAGSEPPPEDEGRAAFPYSDWGPKAAIVGVVVAIVGGALLGIPAIIIDNPPDSGDLSTAANVFVQAMTVLGFVVVPLFVASRGGYGPAETLRRLGVRGFRPSAIGWFFAAAGVYLLLTAIYAALITQPKQEDIASSFGPVWVQVFLIVVCAATSEELCFRGMLFSGIRERVPSLGAALISGAIFGGLHVLTGVTAVPPLIVFGTVLALLYERTGSILPAIALHALNNAVALLAQ